MTSSGLLSDRNSTALIRLVLFAALAVIEMAATSLLFVLDIPHNGLQAFQFYIRRFVLASVASAIAFVVIVWSNRQTLIDSWNSRIEPGSWRQPLAVNLALFAALVIATVSFSRHALVTGVPSPAFYAAYLALLAATGASLVWIAAPPTLWLSLIRQNRMTVAVAIVAGIVAILAGSLAQAAWFELSGITLRLSHKLLLLYEADVRVDYAARSLGVGTFTVLVDQSCSGYEGIGLVLVFLGLYLWVFRSTLRFPNALLLLPIGVVTIWLLNAVRIAALVSLGAHTSPEVAIGGFHSQAGWITFLIVTIGIMSTVPRLSFFSAGERTHPHRSSSDRLILALLAPFMCLMAASIVMAAAAPFDEWFYTLKVAAVGLCLWVFRDIYRGLIARVDALSLAAGAAVGILWIVTAPSAADGGEVGTWIAAQSAWVAALWLTIRAIGSVVMVPIAEELAFRGLLHRWLISRNFETVDYATFSWFAFVVSSLLFGLLHQRWIAGAWAGAAFALLMYRSGRLSDPIAAHMTANGVIIAWAIAAQNWSLL
jgi:exosortase E/protease (VPEID-CTERM system)